MSPIAVPTPGLDPALASALDADLQEVVIVTGTDGRVRSVTPSVERVLGIAAHGLVDRMVAAIVHPSDRRRFALEWHRVAASPGASGRFSGRIVTGPGAVREVEVRCTNRVDVPDVGGIVLSVRDSTDQTRIVAALHAQARTDALTGLPNRLAFEERLARALATPTESPVALTMLDIDRFKIVNDSLGHRAGDALIREVGVRIRDAVRNTDTVARLGGDEFVVLSPMTDLDEAEFLAARIQSVFRTPVTVGTTEIHVSASIGVACTSTSVGVHDDLLRDADVAMYEAKRRGPGEVARYDAGMVAAAQEHLELQGELHRAIQQGEFVVHYQPIVRAADGELASYEALVRWPRLDGTVLPEGFIPVAEASGLIHDLSDRILHLIADDLTATPRSVLPRAWMNLSGHSLMRRNCASRILAAVGERGIELDRLGVEVTETVLMGDPGIVERNLSTLRDHGLAVALDDYGTGWASLSAIKRFPIDVVKIDRTFTAGLTTNALDRAIVRGIAEIGRVLHLEVVAEGIETDEQAWIAADLGCTELQGYRYGRASALRDLPRR
jgi:diguanylate cyclase (GGDEF)-like protein/PAS domain S-box-containing protein